MIPISLKMQNFMAYRDETISFKGIHIACICGSNGSGKSAMWGGVCWALWGKSRAKTDDQLIHLGQKQTEVSFEFEAGGNQHRVTRKRSRSKSANSSLNLEVLHDGAYKPNGGATMAETQQIINNLLHLDYETFVNSAFLRQGHADELTDKPPTERKKVLADILDLSQYDRLEELAKAKAKEQVEYLQVLEVEIGHWMEEVSHRTEYEQELTKKHSIERGVIQNAAEEGIKVIQHKEKGIELDQKRQWLAELQRKEKLSREQLSYWQGELEKLRTKIEQHQKVILQREDILYDMERLAKSRQVVDEQYEKYRQLVGLKERKAAAESTIANEYTRLKGEVAFAEERKAVLVKQSDTSQINDALTKWQAYLQDVVEEEARLSVKRQEMEDVRDEGVQLRMADQSAQRALTEHGEKLEILLEHGGNNCPVCDQPLDDKDRSLIEEAYRARIADLQDEVQSNDIKLNQLLAKHKAMKAAVMEREQELTKGKTDTQARIARLTKELEIAEKAKDDLQEVQAGLDGVIAMLQENAFALLERRELEALAEQIESLSYDERAHDEACRLVKELQPAEAAHWELQEAERLLPEEESWLTKAKEQVVLHSDEAEDAKRAQGDYIWVQSDYDALLEDIKDAEQEEARLRTEQAAIQKEIGSLEQKLRDITNAEKQAKEHRRSIAQAKQDKQVFDDLAVAFGKKGVQALIIDAAIPEIEIEANRLLGQMTDNRMGLVLDTQRETKKGQMVETLDINIWDELGMRSYEMYSGGEAFRINFALRVALSRLLANRAGAPLSLLVVDEGFGSQDADGLDKVIGAINSIQDEFEKIMVITHLDELKDAFPDRIEVSKTEQGSVIKGKEQ